MAVITLDKESDFATKDKPNSSTIFSWFKGKRSHCKFGG